MSYCHVSRQIDEYISERYKIEREEEYLEHQIGLLMQSDFSPSNPDNFLESLGEITREDILFMPSFGEKECDEMLGRYMREQSACYWERKSREHVIKEQEKRIFGTI